MSTALWLILAFFYVVLLFSLGLTTLRNGHIVLFCAGIFLPFLWLIGAILAPTPRAAGVQ